MLFLVFFVISSRNFNVENLNLLRVVSSEARIKSAAEAFSIIEKNPIFGIGFNAYRYAQIRYGLRSGQNVFASHADAGTDNSFLFVLATTGIVGFISYMYIWFKLLKSGSLKTKQNSYWLKPVIISSTIGLFIDALFINSLFYPFIMMWMFCIFGLSVRENR
jgi:O-antigen ligase